MYFCSAKSLDDLVDGVEHEPSTLRRGAEAGATTRPYGKTMRTPCAPLARVVCTLAIYTRVLPGLPLVVAANRDEFYARPASGPTLLASEPRIVGGRDLLAGGTWLARERARVWSSAC